LEGVRTSAILAIADQNIVEKMVQRLDMRRSAKYCKQKKKKQRLDTRRSAKY